MSERLEGISRAYDFVIPSYGWAIQRMEASANRIQGLITYAASLTFAAPVVVKALNEEADLTSAWFFISLGLFAAIGAVGLGLNLLRRGIKVVDPGHLTEDDWLLLSDEDFKLEMVKVAGVNTAHNVGLINWRASISDLLTVALILEVVCLGLWARQAL